MSRYHDTDWLGTVRRAIYPEAVPNDRVCSLLEKLVRPQLAQLRREAARTWTLTPGA